MSYQVFSPQSITSTIVPGISTAMPYDIFWTFYAKPAYILNSRRAHCHICKTSIPAGQGRQWRYNAAHLAPVYLCGACNDFFEQLEQLEPEMHPLRAELLRWCKANISLGAAIQTYDSFLCTLRLAGPLGPDVAEGLLQRLANLPTPTVRQALAAADEVAVQICESQAWGA